MQQPSQVIKEYRITEKASDLQANKNQYTFEVFQQASRTDVANAVAKLFNVKVAKVNILNQKGKVVPSKTARGKFGRKANVKKAIVTLKEGSAITLI